MSSPPNATADMRGALRGELANNLEGVDKGAQHLKHDVEAWNWP